LEAIKEGPGQRIMDFAYGETPSQPASRAINHQYVIWDVVQNNQNNYLQRERIELRGSCASISSIG
jgi:hypothetical protein